MVEKLTSNPDYQPADPNLKSKIQNLKFGQAWLGETMPTLDELWHKYLRRFALEHWYRFAKQRLYWTHPQLSSTQAAERWSDLMPLLTWQLWLAREACIDCPLPWQSSQDKLSPGRVAQGFPTILAEEVVLLPHPPKPVVNHLVAPKGIDHHHVLLIPLSKNTLLKKLNSKNHLIKLTLLLLSFD